MNVGIIGLGRMGRAIAQRLLRAGHQVYGFDPEKETLDHAASIGVKTTLEIKDLLRYARIIWLMVPAGEAIDKIIEEL